MFWTGITIFRLYSDSEHSAAALSAAGGLSPHETNIPVSSGADVTVSTASSTTLAETTKEKPSVFGNPCQLQGGDERPPFTVGNKRARKRLARDAVGPMFEFACSPNSSMGNVFKDLDIPHVRLAKEYIDLESAVADEQLAYQLSQCVRPNLWAAIPCVSGSPWQRLNLHRLGKPFKKKLEEKVKQSKVMFSKFALHAEHVLKAGGSVTFEWPRDCEGWQRPDVAEFFGRHKDVFHGVSFHGCAVGLTDENGSPIKKPWHIKTTSKALAEAFADRQCPHTKSEKHTPAAGSRTSRTAFYPEQMCGLIAKALYPKACRTPVQAMPVVPVTQQTEHRVKEQSRKHESPLSGADDFTLLVESDSKGKGIVEELLDVQSLLAYAVDMPSKAVETEAHAMVTKLLSRAEMLASPEALEAIKQEATGLQDVGVWDSSTVREKAEVAAQARQSGIKVHFGQLMTIASIKFYELAKHLQKVKGRIVFRGDCAKDEAGAPAVYQELGANPTSVQGLNACLAYGRIPGHTVTTADAVKAYVQAFLSSQFQTWIELPPELRPKEWGSKFVKPVVLLIRALYGHPDAGGLWEAHLPGPPFGTQKCGPLFSARFFGIRSFALSKKMCSFAFSPFALHDEYMI